MNRPWVILCLALASAACDERGVSVGTAELCQLDPLLSAAQEQSGSTEALPPCASIGDSRLVDGGFETPSVEDCNGSFCQFPASEVPGWDTTGELQQIEIWSKLHLESPAFEGNQLVELDASTQDTVFQDLALSAGQLLYWSLAHRGRNGLETMELLIGPPEAPVSQRVLESPADNWTTYSGLYRVGRDESITRFALASRSGTSEGNLVDGVTFAPVE